MSFHNLLVANRGEIAVRVLRTARELGLHTVAVHSEADAGAPHVRLADEAVCIGPPPVSESYLSIERILAAARSSGAEAVHPGYGFLSENAAFARACGDAGLVFVGPPPAAIELMGNKAAAKRRMIEAGVPCVPGYEEADQSDAAFVAAAERIGYPVMVKAAAGGGGRGMRLVTRAADLAGALRTARSEALNAFGSDELILEKAIVRPRHVEMQVFADAHGGAVHLGERDCSVQRRHQKVIEEAPCPVMTPELRRAMGEAAVEAALAVDYRGAGTVEFLLDADGRFYFLEMNTRLQVEHPVTEMITGLDLVALQIRVARGLPLGFSQEDVHLDGHAIEVRLYAEDTTQDFLPCTGRVDLWLPAEGEGLRVDAGIATGQEIPPFYDPMLAKVIAWGPDRYTARRRLIAGLADTALFGLRTNRDFLLQALARDTFARGEATTAFLADDFDAAALAAPVPGARELAVAAVLECRLAADAAEAAAPTSTVALRGWSNSGLLTSRLRYQAGDETVDVTVMATSATTWTVECLRGDRVEATLDVRLVAMAGPRARVSVDGQRWPVLFGRGAHGELHMSLNGRTWSLRDLNASVGVEDEAAGGGRVVAPMHGLLIEVAVQAGDRVSRGTRLAVLEAMKMQHEILSAVTGTVTEVLFEAGTQVAAGTVLIEVEEAEG
jgi:geranyl-CoA carboxylase alpha subunit